MKIITLISMLCFGSGLCHSQQFLNLSGKVVDVNNDEPLAFASVRLKGKTVGAVTNEDGVFDFYVSSQEIRDTLMISMLGYASFEIPTNEFLEGKKTIVRMKIRPIELNEIIISDKELTPRKIVAKAFENVKVNYPMQPYVARCFYRETHQENKKSVMLVEAVLDIHDKGYQVVHGGRSSIREGVNLENVRASQNYRNKLFINTVVERYNLVVSALRFNLVKYRNHDGRKGSDKNSYTLERVTNFNNDLVYVISFLSYISRHPNFERKNTLYIDARTYAIYKYQWEEYAKEGKYSEGSWRLTKDSTYFSKRKRISSTYEYERYNGKMFLKYFDEKCWDDIYNSKADSVEFETLGHTTLILSGLETTQTEPEIVNPMKPDRSLYSQATAYSPEFWNNYKHALPLTNKEIRDLEWQTPLEEQFRKNGYPK